MKTWKIGTRGSLLALTQCGQIRDLLSQKTGEKFELVIIKTRGDQQTDVPLWQLEGKDFFTRELDTALLAGEVDLVVHSYKDLGSERPDGIKLGAITERTYGNDILLIEKEKIAALKNGDLKKLIVGTSSPRRIVNLTNHLGRLMPSAPAIETKTLRGNVNTRVQKLRNGEYDAIVLAMPGLERLALDANATKELGPLVNGLDYMILPPSLFPWAASQGALAIEMWQDHPQANELSKILASVHDNATEAAVKRERKAFNDYGGGCHLAVGVAVMQTKDFFVHSHRGERDQEKIEQQYIEPPVAKVTASATFAGMPNEDLLIEKVPVEVAIDSDDKDLFVTSSHVFKTLDQMPKPKSIWAAGTKTWEKLASKGHWVNGCADSLGEKQLRNFANSALLKLMRQKSFEWLVLSGEEAHSELGPVVETYKRQEKEITADFVQTIENKSDFFWTSYAQYQSYVKRFPNIQSKRHWCGLGKTYDAFALHHIPVIAVSGISEFKQVTGHK